MSFTFSALKNALLAMVVGLSFIAVSANAAAPTHFDWRTDTIAFSNDTVFSYGIDEAGRLTMHKREKAPDYAHRCFVLARAVMQFHKFARFAPEQPRISSEEYRWLAKHISRIPVWFPERPMDKRVVIPGYKNLNEFSRGQEHMLKQTLGGWWPSYLRIGNWRMTFPFPRYFQAVASRQIIENLDRGNLQAVYVTRALHMNHAVVLFDHHTLPNGDIQFDAYDPNYPNQLSHLLYHPSERSFDFEKRWFWPGGRVNLMRVFISPVH